MKTITKRKMVAVILTSLLLFCFLTVIAYAQATPAEKEKPEKKQDFSINQHYWRESNTKRADYTMWITFISYKDLRFRYDFIDYDDKDNLSRYWVNYYKYPLIKGKDFNVTLWPGVHWDQKSRTFYGGDILISAPKLGLSITQRSYGGDNADKHYTFANLQLGKSKQVKAFLSYYLLAAMHRTPDAYLGPKVTVGNWLSVWYGFGAAREGANLLDASITVRF